MRFLPFASCCLAVAFFLSACGSDAPSVFSRDQVPDDVKAAPRSVGVDAPPVDTAQWPLIGAVPFKPKTFSPKPVYNHYMDEMEYDRDEGQSIRARGGPENGDGAAVEAGR